jgi:hypothetical protein
MYDSIIIALVSGLIYYGGNGSGSSPKPKTRLAAKPQHHTQSKSAPQSEHDLKNESNAGYSIPGDETTRKGNHDIKQAIREKGNAKTVLIIPKSVLKHSSSLIKYSNAIPRPKNVNLNSSGLLTVTDSSTKGNLKMSNELKDAINTGMPTISHEHEKSSPSKRNHSETVKEEIITRFVKRHRHSGTFGIDLPSRTQCLDSKVWIKRKLQFLKVILI